MPPGAAALPSAPTASEVFVESIVPSTVEQLLSEQTWKVILPVSFVSLYAYINPVIAVALGVLFLHESFDARMAAAAALVFGGVAVVRWTGRQTVSDSGLEAQGSLADP